MIKFEKTGYRFFDDPLLNKVMWYNGLLEEQDLSKTVTKHIRSYEYCFKDTEKLKQILLEAKAKNEVIDIFYDYDSDGENGGTILSRICDYYGVKYNLIDPDRKIGFGIFKQTVDKALAIPHKPFMVWTVDLGGKAVEVLNYARNNGYKYIAVVDHHDWSEGIEDVCDVWINPHYEPQFPFADICGAMTAYLVAIELLKDMCTRGQIGELAELAATATITDVMPLFDINRSAVNYLVANAKKNILHNEGLTGIAKEQNITFANFTAEDIGYKIGPMLNASGRLASARLSLDILKEKNPEMVLSLTPKLKELNEERKQITKDLVSQITIVQNKINIFAFDNAHEGIIGIIAGNITEDTGCPSFVFTKTEKGYKGSGRSPLAYNLIQNVTKIFDNHPELVVAYGGHSGAMGLTLKDLDSVHQFEQLINENYKELGCPKDDKYYIEFPFNETPEKVYERLEKLEPYGEGFEKPVFHVCGYISKLDYIKDEHSKFYIMTNYKEKYGLNMFFFKNVIDKDEIKGTRYDIYFTLGKGSAGVNGSVIKIEKRS